MRDLPLPALDRRSLLSSAGAGVLAATMPAPARADRAATSLPALPQGRELLSLDTGWRFFEGDVPFAPVLDHEASYAATKAGNATGAASTDFDDADWARVSLPHDFALTQPYDPKANLDQGYRRRGIGWYRRTFALDEADRGRHLELRFDGIATNATIWINGTLVHRSFSGFTGFAIDLTPFALFGEDLNTLAVRVDADASEAWWYEGAGIYRHAWLVKRPAMHIATDGIHARPRRGADGRWTVEISAELAHIGERATRAGIEAQLFDPAGRPIATARTDAAIAAYGTANAALVLPVVEPQLWSPDTPSLYTLRVALVGAGGATDAIDTRIGLRTLRFDAAQGFFLNDQPLKIQGVCVHQDHAGVGVAVPDSLWDFRVRRIKAMGANAVRCAHNPPAAEFLDAADRLGLMVLDEARMFNASEDYLPQLDWMVRRDRNHPSVILWSLCNEESFQTSQPGIAMIRRMKARVRGLDDDRPVTAAMNSGFFATANIGQELDVVGFNYGSADYDRFHAEHPGTPFYASEDSAAYMTRGEWTTDMDRHVLASYDENNPGYGASYRRGWEQIARRPFVAGGFLWTGIDYRGEPSPFEWPNASSSFGAMDLCGFPKNAFFLRRAMWVKDRPLLDLAPHWTWPGREGQPIKVMAITNAERVVLSLNGKIVADLEIDPFEMASAMIPYAPGRLSAIAYRGGKPVAQTWVETAGAPVRLRLTPDRATIAGDGRDAMPVTVELLDAAGRAIPTANIPVAFGVRGGAIIGLGNGDARSHEPDKPGPEGARRSLYNGLAQVIVTADPGASVLMLSARAEGMRGGELRLPIGRVALPPGVAPQDNVQSLTEWRTSPPSAVRPDMRERVAEGDMNSWGWLKPGSTQSPYGEGRYYRYQVGFTPRAEVQRRGGQLVFGRLTGRAEVWIDGTLVGRKESSGVERLAVPLAPGADGHVITVLFDAPLGAPPYGIAGAVKVEPKR